MAKRFSVRVDFTDGSHLTKVFEKKESAVAWLHGTVAVDLTKSVLEVSVKGEGAPTLEDLMAEPRTIVEVRASMPEPNFEANAGEGLSWMESCDTDVLRMIEEGSPVAEVEAPRPSVPVMVPDAPVVVEPKPEAKAEPEPTTKIPCPSCVRGVRTWIPNTGPNAGKVQSGPCYRCASQYKRPEDRGFQTAEDVRRNRDYDLRRTPERLKIRFKVGERVYFQEAARTTEMFTLEKAIPAVELKPGSVILVASVRATDPVLHQAEVVEVLAAK